MTSATGTLSIASFYSVCIQSFDRLCDLLQSPDCEFSSQISVLDLQDELGRFRVWAGNVGAHRSGRVSLDHKLREASQIHNKVTELLKDLDEALQEGEARNLLSYYGSLHVNGDSVIAIVSHERKPSDQLSWPSDSSTSSLEDGSIAEPEDEMDSTTELQERFLEIAHVITCLYKFSIVIRNPAPRDRLQKCASIDVSHYEFFDIQHTSHKFPVAGEYLIDRLGKANSRRRQLFKYQGSHHNKLTKYIDLRQPEGALVGLEHRAGYRKELLAGMDGVPGSGDRRLYTKKGPGTIATTVNTQTTVSTYVQRPSDTIEVCSDAGQSQTSYATSSGGDKGSKLRVPPPPKPESAYDGKPFECPYCFSIKIVRGTHSWMKHVFRDLRPYICTFKDCSKPDRLFESRHDWYSHEVEVHRREWFCNVCRKPFLIKANFKNHLRQKHSDLFTETQLPAMADRCERAIESDQVCPICEGGPYPPPRFQSHLAHHMQQLALFTLPKMATEAKYEGGNGDGGSLGAQASKADTEESARDNTDLDSDSSQENLSDTQHELPGTRDEMWAHVETARDPNDGEPPLGFGEKVEDVIEPLRRVSSGKMEEMKRTLGPEHPDTLTSMANLALMYMNQGRLEDAEELQVQVVASRERVLGIDHPDTLAAMAILASTHWDRGRWKEAGELEVKVMEEAKKTLGPEHPDTLIRMSNLALTYVNQGCQKEAEELQLLVLASREKVFGKDHPSTLEAMANLASTYWEQGRLNEAEALDVQVMTTRQKILGGDHPDTLAAMARLVSTYLRQERWNEAGVIGVKVREEVEKILGSEHPDTLISMANLALTYVNQGRLNDAEELQVQVVASRETVIGKDHPDTLTAIANLASTYWNQGRWAEAEVLDLQVMTTRQKILGEDHPDTLEAMTKLAWTYIRQGRLKEAEELEVQVLATRKRIRGEDHPHTLVAMTNLASTYWNQGRMSDAEELQAQVVRRREKVLGGDHPDTLVAMAKLASMYLGLGRFKEAGDLQMQVIAASQKILGEDHPDILEAMANLASSYWGQGRLDEANDLRVQVVSKRKETLGEDHPDTLAAMAKLAWTYLSQGRLKEAKDLQVEVVASRKTTLGEDHPDTLEAMVTLTWTCLDHGLLEEAEALEAQVMATRQRILGENHPHTLTAMANLVSTYLRQGRWKEADDLKGLLEKRRSILEHPDTLTS